MIPDLSGALFLPDHKTLVVADLHLEHASSLARRGLYLPPYDSRSSLSQLGAVVAACQPTTLILLGDSFHDTDAGNRISGEDLASIRALTGRLDTIWITGNHDPHLPDGVGGRVVEEVQMGAVRLRHEPRVLDADSFEIAGHLHPGAVVSQRGRNIRCKCFIANAQRLILPAFGCFTGAFSISAPPFRPLFPQADYHVWMLGDSAIFKLPARRVS
jgi:DNA ligase-associated metallophosphoesterase